MAKQSIGLNKEGTDFLDELKHPFREELEQLLSCILAANNKLSKNIKWNGPNYCFDKKTELPRGLTLKPACRHEGLQGSRQVCKFQSKKQTPDWRTLAG